MTKKLGVVGTMVWDTIVGRSPGEPPLEEWGGIGYALAGLEASLPAGWEVVPLVKVGSDLYGAADLFLRRLSRGARGARFVEVSEPNNRVTLFYQSAERRCERMAGGVPPWTWSELGPMIRDLDALYVNFISGFECDLATAQWVRRAFRGPLYGDLHSLLCGIGEDGVRQLRQLEDARAWMACFDFVQLNEDEMLHVGADPLAVAAEALGAGVRAVCVTLGARGAVYLADAAMVEGADGADADEAATRPVPTHPMSGTKPAARMGWYGARAGADRAPWWVAGPAHRARPLRTALVPTDGEPVSGDPTGCGDVFGAALFSGLLAGRDLVAAIREANRLARRNAAYRGATGLEHHLRGHLVPGPAR